MPDTSTTPLFGKIVCVGRNYAAHARELGNDVPAAPLLFLKPISALIGNGGSVILPGASSHVEYEGEIGLVIGRRLRHATAADCATAVRGLVALNDVTARDLQRSEPQWTRAKGFDTFCPVGGEWRVPPDDAPAIWSELTVVTRVNGTERQRGDTANMVFSVPTLLAHISAVMTLEPGDLVATGTPAGVAPLSSGDQVEVSVLRGAAVLSQVTNPVTADAQRA